MLGGVINHSRTRLSRCKIAYFSPEPFTKWGYLHIYLPLRLVSPRAKLSPVASGSSALVAQSARIASHLTHFHTYKSAATPEEGGVVLPHLEWMNMQMSDCFNGERTPDLCRFMQMSFSVRPAFKTSIKNDVWASGRLDSADEMNNSSISDQSG